jgi:F-type H+-transporting ATPase subunit b
MAEARSSAQSLLAEAKSQSERERTAAVEKTKAEQEEMLARARREIGAERERAIADLRLEAVDLSLAAASRLVGQRLDSESDRNLVDRLPRVVGDEELKGRRHLAELRGSIVHAW